MFQGNSIGDGGAVGGLAGIAAVLKSRETWRVSARYLLLVVSTLVTFSVLAAAVPTFLGMDSFIVGGGSMRPAVPAGALVVAQRVDPVIVQAGEIITFRHSTSPNTPVTHRVVKVLLESNGSVNLLTKGDANAAVDPETVATDLPVSRMVYSLPYAGYVLEFSHTSAGKVGLIAAPALLLLLSIGRKSRITAGSEIPAQKKAVTMVNTSRSPSLSSAAALGTPASALARLAQRPVLSPRVAERPGLARRLIAAFQAAPEVAMPETPAFVETPSRGAMPLRAVAAPRAPRAAAAPMPAMASAPRAASVTEATLVDDDAPSLLDFTRLRLRSVARLADIMRSFDLVETEAALLLNLVTDLDLVRRCFAENLDEAMRPLAEFADRWDDSLATLAQRMDNELPPQIDIVVERRRIMEIRAQIPQRHMLLLSQFEVEKQAIDAALTVFDDQVARLETQLTAARRTAEAIGDSMRTADFGRTVEFLRGRTEQLVLLAERGAATPEDIADALPAASALLDDEEMLASSPYLRSVMEVLEHDGAATETSRVKWGAA